MTRMLIIDDEFYIRKGIRNAIDWNSVGVEIVGEAKDGEEGLELFLSLEPDLVLTDIRMPFLDGLELIEKITSYQVNCGIIVLSGYDEFEYAQSALRYGVLDYLLKPIDKEKLKETVLNAGNTVRNRRSVQHYRQLIDQEQATIRTQFLKDFLFHRITDEHVIREKINSLKLPLENSSYQMICIKLDDFDLLERQFSVENMHEWKDFISACLAEHLLLSKSFMGMLLEVSLEEWAVVLTHLDTASAAEKEKELREKIHGLLKELEEHSANTVSVSISPICYTLQELPGIYQTARLSNKKYIPCTNSVVWSDHPELENVRPEVQNALTFIRQHYGEDITVQQVADALYLSPYYLMHIFKNDVGKTFHTFLTEYRMETAKELLREQDCRIYEIAARVGYSDVKYFNKLFKKYTSLTPSDYIRIHYAKI